MTANKKYRERVYRGYVSARNEPLAPSTVEGLKPRSAYLNQLIKNHFPVNLDAKILELGCGHGAIMYFAQKQGYNSITGIDGSAEQVRAADKLGVQNVTHADVLDTLRATASGSLDAVVTFDLIEHFTKDELIGLVDEILRVLMPGGKWIIHVPNGESPFFGCSFYGDFTHEVAFTQTSLSQLVLSSGFSSIECYEDRPIAKNAKGMLRYVIWRFFRGVMQLYLAAETGSTARNGIFSQNMLAVVRK